MRRQNLIAMNNLVCTVGILTVMMSLVSCNNDRRSDCMTDRTERVEYVYVHGDKSSSHVEHRENKREDEVAVRRLDVSVRPTLCLEPQAGNSYDATNLLDQSPRTAWAVPLSKAIDADVIDLLTFRLDARKVKYIVIQNGYAKDKKSFINNARGKHIVISREPWEMAMDEDILYEGMLADTPEPQVLYVSDKYDNTVPTHTVYVKFSSDVYPGQKYNDFCVSELSFYGIE